MALIGVYDLIGVYESSTAATVIDETITLTNTCMNYWLQRKVKTNKTASVAIDVSYFTLNEPITSATLTSENNKTTIGTATLSTGKVSALMTGINSGLDIIHLNYSTATRNNCAEFKLEVVNC